MANDLCIKIGVDGKTWVDNPVNNYKVLIDTDSEKSECNILL